MSIVSTLQDLAENRESGLIDMRNLKQIFWQYTDTEDRCIMFNYMIAREQPSKSDTDSEIDQVFSIQTNEA